MMLHGEVDDCPIIAVQHNDQIQLVVSALNLRNIAQVFDARHCSGKISPHQTVILLSCQKVCFWLQMREKERKAVAEWYLISNRLACNWYHKDTNISVSNLFNLADFLS